MGHGKQMKQLDKHLEISSVAIKIVTQKLDPSMRFIVIVTLNT